MTDSELIGYVKQYHKTVYRLAYSYVRNCADAEDICQDAFVRLMDFSGEFSSDEDCKRWLIRVVINLSKNLLKSCRFSRTEELSEDIPLETAEDGELLSLVKSLPTKYGEVIHLFYYEGYSVKEISQILRISQTAVTSRLSRGRNKLKLLLMEGNNDE
ncbi:MAG: RNA polymerase sigma factor [Oscillospiraceae bacterium]